MQIYNMNTYIKERLDADAQDFRDSGKVRSGYKNLDSITNLYPGLYVIGATSSLGKTTFMHQMGDQIAQSGHPVLFFSFEQSALELISKSLAREIAKTSWWNAADIMTSLQIRNNPSDNQVKKAIQAYSDIAKNLFIVECDFNSKVSDIGSVVADFIKNNDVKPVVIVDYLQVIKPVSTKYSSREAIDSVVSYLKDLQREHKITMVVISSLNRQNYMTSVDFESFKESGGIEYTADVVWGLQLDVLRDPIFDEQGKINEKRALIKNAKSVIPRKIEFVCLKNRFGVSSFECYFDYYSDRDLFVSKDYSVPYKTHNTDSSNDDYRERTKDINYIIPEKQSEYELCDDEVPFPEVEEK